MYSVLVHSLTLVVPSQLSSFPPCHPPLPNILDAYTYIAYQINLVLHLSYASPPPPYLEINKKSVLIFIYEKTLLTFSPTPSLPYTVS